MNIKLLILTILIPACYVPVLYGVRPNSRTKNSIQSRQVRQLKAARKAEREANVIPTDRERIVAALENLRHHVPKDRHWGKYFRFQERKKKLERALAEQTRIEAAVVDHVKN